MYVYTKIVPRAEFLSVVQDLFAYTSDKDKGDFCLGCLPLHIDPVLGSLPMKTRNQ